MHYIHLILQKVIIISCSLCYSPKWLVIIQMHSPTAWHASTLGQVLMKQFHSSHKHLYTIPVLTLLPRIWLIAALSFRVHSATTFALISFMYNIKAFRGFLMWGLFGSCSFLCSCWGFTCIRSLSVWGCSCLTWGVTIAGWGMPVVWGPGGPGIMWWENLDMEVSTDSEDG